MVIASTSCRSRIEWAVFCQRLYVVVGLTEWHYMMSTLLLYNITRLTV